jgi:flavin-dependent dehydrogenase
VITGVDVEDQPAVEADLVIDASGRASHSPRWLEQLGYERPGEIHVRCLMGYAARLVRVPDGVLPPQVYGLLSLPFPGHHRGGLLFIADNGYWVLAAAGVAKDYPPVEEGAFLEFLDGSPIPSIGRVAREVEPVSPIVSYRMPGNQVRLWDQLPRMPRRLIVTGDAVGSYNPVYGQGMTQSAKAGVLLRDTLAAHDDLDTAASAFQKDMGELAGYCCEVSGKPDSLYDGVKLINFERWDDESVAKATALEALATEDPAVTIKVARAQLGMRPEELESPELDARIEERLATGKGSANNDRTTLPPLVELATT